MLFATTRTLAYSFVILLLTSACLQAAEVTSVSSAPGTVLARTGTTEITIADYEAEIARLPEDSRAGFGADPARVESLLNNMLRQRMLAGVARERGIDKEDLVRRRVASEIDRLYAAELLARIDAASGAQFDGLPNTDRQAREQYLLELDNLRVPEQVDITQIFFDTARRGSAEAMRQARDTRARIVAGESMTLLARQLSDDPGARRNGGRWTGQTRDALDPALADAAFALRAPGDLSEPVSGKLGVYLVRLEERRAASTPSFEQARGSIVAKMRKAYVDRRRTEEIAKLFEFPDLYVNREAVDSLITRPGR